MLVICYVSFVLGMTLVLTKVITLVLIKDNAYYYQGAYACACTDQGCYDCSCQGCTPRVNHEVPIHRSSSSSTAVARVCAGSV